LEGIIEVTEDSGSYSISIEERFYESLKINNQKEYQVWVTDLLTTWPIVKSKRGIEDCFEKYLEEKELPCK